MTDPWAPPEGFLPPSRFDRERARASGAEPEPLPLRDLQRHTTHCLDHALDIIMGCTGGCRPRTERRHRP